MGTPPEYRRSATTGGGTAPLERREALVDEADGHRAFSDG
jgi:hypothetical protein